MDNCMAAFGDLKVSKDEKNVRFKDVTVYYFPREQGFGCVPHEGGSTLGMSYGHTDFDTYSLVDHAKMRKRSYQSALGDSIEAKQKVRHLLKTCQMKLTNWKRKIGIILPNV